jgi:DNA polymerase-3 subunit chi
MGQEAGLRVDFYLLEGLAPEAALADLAARALGAGERVLVVAEDAALHARISERLWQGKPGQFLAHGPAGGPDDARQPILLADTVAPANGARMVMLADGQWRDGLDGFARVFLLFDAATVEAARGLWRELSGREGVERHFWKQEGGRWSEAG